MLCVGKKKVESALPLEGVLMGTAQCLCSSLLAYKGMKAYTKTKSKQPLVWLFSAFFLRYAFMQFYMEIF